MLIIQDEKFSAIIELLKTIWAPSVVALVSYFIARLNIKIKKVEIQGQTELKARELTFNSYQKRVEKSDENTRAVLSAMAKNSKDLANIADQNERIARLRRFLVLLKEQISFGYNYFEDLTDDLKTSGLSNEKLNRRIDYVNNIMKKEIDKLQDSELDNYYNNLSRALSLMSSLEYDFVEKKRDEIFSGYLKKKKSFISRWLSRN